MTALQAHPAIRLPVRRLAPTIIGAAVVAGGVLVGAVAALRPGEVATAAIAGGAVVLAVSGMLGVLALLRFGHLLTLTTAVMGLSMARLVASVGMGVGCLLLASPVDGAKPDKVVFAVVFLGTWLVVLGVETPVLRAAVRRLADPATVSSSASASASGSASGSASLPLSCSTDTLGLNPTSRAPGATR